MNYPAASTNYQHATGIASIVDGDRWDWDVLGHEYGHFISRNYNLTDSPGGPHSFGVSSIPTLGKGPGSKIAWGEGHANYTGLAMQHVLPFTFNRPTSLQTVGDTVYRDDYDGDVTVNWETDAGSGVAGEGEEIAVTRILWDIADPKNEAWDRVERGHKQLYADMAATAAAQGDSKLSTLSQLNNYMLNTLAANDTERVDFGAIFQKYSISPDPVGTVIDGIFDVTDPAPTFEWLRKNNNANDTFRLTIWDEALSARIIDNFLIPGDVTSYTLTAAQWALVGEELGNKKFVITGSDLKTPGGADYAGVEATGPYWSDAYSFTVVPEPTFTALLLVPSLGLLQRRRR